MHSFIAYDTPFIRWMHFTMEPHSRYAGNVQFEASKVYTKTAIMAEQFIVGMWPTISHLLPPKTAVRIPHIGM